MSERHAHPGLCTELVELAELGRLAASVVCVRAVVGGDGLHTSSKADRLGQQTGWAHAVRPPENLSTSV
jgi:hypothetical protein